MPIDTEIAIAVLLPDLLGTYSDSGNAAVLAKRLRWRGIAARTVPVTATDSPPHDCDLYLIGGGEDNAQHAAGRWLLRHPHLSTVLLDRAVTFAVCAGLQLLGRSVTGLDGLSRPGLGLLDLTTRPGPRRQIGESVSRCSIPGVGRLTGFHNHRGVTRLGPTARALADTESGPSNHPDATTEGALATSGPHAGIVATYLHGPVLARNPALADHLLVRAVGGPLPELDPGRLPDMPHLRGSYLVEASSATARPSRRF